jgi:serine protease Do
MVEDGFDLALLKVNPEVPLEVAVFATASRVREGQRTLVIGNPLGMGQSIMKGILGTSRPVSWDGHRAPLHAVQAAIVKGNSGGGTFDLQTGELLGINVAKSSASQNTGYMVPVDRLVAILNRKIAIVELADSQEIYNSLGVRLRPVSLLEGKFSRGMLVTEVRPGSRAAAAGWEVGDVLVGMDKYKMVDQDAVLYVLRDTARDASQVNFLVARGDVIDGGRLHLEGQTAMAASASTSGATRDLAAAR